MRVQSLKLVYFSPTGTTKKIIQGIAKGINHGDVKFLDITKPNARKQQLKTTENELLIVAVPVYKGRVSGMLIEWLHSIQANNTPTVCIVVYGNRAYEDALLELKDTLTERGCIPIACAAYIGEHSFSSSNTPIAEGRPNANDLTQAELFGRKISEKLLSVSSADRISEIQVPGIYPYRGDNELLKVDFISVDNTCLQCGSCAEGCPVGAIDLENSHSLDVDKCVTCCACIKNCPQNSRIMKTGFVNDIAVQLNKLYHEPKNSEFFL